MAVDANTAFLCKQIALSEICGGTAEDLDHGLLVSNNGLWMALWDLDAAPTIELIIKDAQRQAEAASTTLRGALLLTNPADEQKDAVAEISDALFIYGLAPKEESERLPGQIQVLGKPEFPKAGQGIDFAHLAAGSDEAPSILGKDALGVTELLGPVFNAIGENQPYETTIGTKGGEIVARACHSSSGACRRILGLRAADDATFGLVLKAVSEYSEQQGELLLTAWSSRRGTLRYALSGLGFNPTLSARFFVAE